MNIVNLFIRESVCSNERMIGSDRNQKELERAIRGRRLHEFEAVRLIRDLNLRARDDSPGRIGNNSEDSTCRNPLAKRKRGSTASK